MSKNLKNIVKRILKESEFDWVSDTGSNIDKINVGAEFESWSCAVTFIIDEIHWREERPMDSIVDISGVDYNKHQHNEFTNHFSVSDILNWLDDEKIKPRERTLKESELDWFSDMNIDKIKVGAKFKSVKHLDFQTGDAGTFIIDEILWNERSLMHSAVKYSGVDYKGFKFLDWVIVKDFLRWLDDGTIVPIEDK